MQSSRKPGPQVHSSPDMSHIHCIRLKGHTGTLWTWNIVETGFQTSLMLLAFFHWCLTGRKEKMDFFFYNHQTATRLQKRKKNVGNCVCVYVCVYVCEHENESNREVGRGQRETSL